MSKTYIARSYTCLPLLLGILMVLLLLSSWVSAANAADVPSVVSAGTDHLGKKIILELDKPMADPSGSQAQFKVSVDGIEQPVTGATLGSNANQILLSLADRVIYLDDPSTIILSYTKGMVTTAEGIYLESFTNQEVTNNVIPLELVDYEPSATEIACNDDPKGGKIVKYRFDNPVDYDEVNLAIYFTNGFFRNFEDNLANYVKFYNKNTGAEVELPNKLTEPVPFTGTLPDGYMEYTDWYFKQARGRVPLGLALKSRALEPDTTYVIEVLKGFSFHSGPIDNTFSFEFTTTAESSTKPHWDDGSSIKIYDVTGNSLTLTWSAATDDVAVTNYKLYQDGSVRDIVYGTTTTYRVTGLNPGTAYVFKVEAGDADGNWSTAGPSTSVSVSASNDSDDTTDTQPPEWPSTNAAVTVSRNQTEATLTWPAATDNRGVTGYRIKRDGVELSTVDGSTFTYTESGLERGNNAYVWSVEAVDAAGNWSTSITGRGVTGQNCLSFDAARSSLTTVSGDNSTDDGPIMESTTVPVRPTIRLYFNRGVTTNAVWSHNQECLSLQERTGSNVSINVFRLGFTKEINHNLHYIFIKPLVDLTPGETYRIIIDKNMMANNGHTLGENNGNQDKVVTFTVASGASNSNIESESAPGEPNDSGLASVDPNQGATVGLGSDAVLEIPAGALKETAPTNVTIEKVTEPPAAPQGTKAVSAVYEITVGGKSSYSFNNNVTLTLNFDPSAIGADEIPVIFYYDESSAKWVHLGGTVSGSTISVQVGHLTKYAVFSLKKAPDVPIEQPVVTLKDMAGHWSENRVKKLVTLGAVSGYPDGSFKPDHNITRAEFTVILVKAFKLAPNNGKVFADTAGHWARDTISTAAYYDIVNGYDANTFGPNDLVSREQMAVMIVKAAGLTPVAVETSFADNDNISGWARNSVATAVKNGIIKGYPDNTFRPRSSATRAEAATVIINALDAD